MHSIKLLFLSIMFFLGGCEAPPQVPKNDYEKAVFNAQRSSEDTTQDERRKPAEILEFSEVVPGQIVVDFQAGSGYYSEIFSYYLGKNGKVYLHNLPSKAEREDVKSKIGKRLSNSRLSNVEPVNGELSNFNFPEKANLFLLSKVFHDLYISKEEQVRNKQLTSFFEQLDANLAQKGRVLVIDHSAVLGSGISMTPETHRIDPNFVIEEFKTKGFKLVKRSDILSVKDDDKTLNIWESKVRNNTDRFVLLFEKL